MLNAQSICNIRRVARRKGALPNVQPGLVHFGPFYKMVGNKPIETLHFAVSHVRSVMSDRRPVPFAAFWELKFLDREVPTSRVSGEQHLQDLRSHCGSALVACQ
jgi:hypothetical protein